jgi:hypothetical protein
MLYIKVKDNTRQAKGFVEYVKTLPFVEIIDIENPDKLTKEQLLDDIKKSLKEIKDKKAKPLKNLINGK